MEESKYKAPASMTDKAPWLIVTHSNNKKGVVVDKQSFFSMSENRMYSKSIVDLDGNLFVGSCFGWLVLRQRNNDGMYSLWNPVTSQCLRLPELEDAPKQLPCCAFTSSPDTESIDAADACLVVLCFEGLVCFCCPIAGEEYFRWFRHRLETQDDDKASVEVTHAVTLNGLIYAELHEDVKTSIANHMHLVDYLNLCVAYKNFDTNMTLAKWLTDRSLPLFTSLKSNNHLCELWDPRENLRHSFNTPNLADHLTTIDFCNNGWLLLRVEGDSLQYLNPITREFGTYPYNEMIQACTSYAFSTYPTSPDCITVGIEGYNDLTIHCFEAAKNEWTYHSFGYNPDEGDVEFWASNNTNPMYYDGAFYFLDMKGNLGIFEMFEGETYFDVHRSPLNEEERLTLYSCYLVEINGQLTSVFFHKLGKTVRVFNFDVVTTNWDELHDLGEYVLYLSLASSFSKFEEDIAKRNRIYLTRYVGDKIVYYSHVTSKYHTLGNEDTMKDLYGTSCQPYCCWI